MQSVNLVLLVVAVGSATACKYFCRPPGTFEYECCDDGNPYFNGEIAVADTKTSISSDYYCNYWCLKPNTTEFVCCEDINPFFDDNQTEAASPDVVNAEATQAPSRCYYYCAYDGEVYCCGDDSRPSEYKTSSRKTLSAVSVKLPDSAKTDKHRVDLQNLTAGNDDPRPLPNYFRLPLHLLRHPPTSSINIPGDPPDDRQNISPPSVGTVESGEASASETKTSDKESGSMFSPFSSLFSLVNFSTIDIPGMDFPSMDFPNIFSGFQTAAPDPTENTFALSTPLTKEQSVHADGPISQNLIADIKNTRNQKRHTESQENDDDSAIWLPILTKSPSLSEASRTKPPSFHDLPSGTVITVHKPSTFMSSLAAGGPIVIDDATEIKSNGLSTHLGASSPHNTPFALSPTFHIHPTHAHSHALLNDPRSALHHSFPSNPLDAPYPPGSPFAPVHPPLVSSDSMPAEPMSYDILPPSYEMVPPPPAKAKLPPPEPDFDVEELDQLLNSIFCECEENENGDVAEDCACGDLGELVLVFPPKPLDPYIFVPLSALPSKSSSDSIPPVIYREQAVPVSLPPSAGEYAEMPSVKPVGNELPKTFLVNSQKGMASLPFAETSFSSAAPVPITYGFPNPEPEVIDAPTSIKYPYNDPVPVNSQYVAPRPIAPTYGAYASSPSAPTYGAYAPSTSAPTYGAFAPIHQPYTTIPVRQPNVHSHKALKPLRPFYELHKPFSSAHGRIPIKQAYYPPPKEYGASRPVFNAPTLHTSPVIEVEQVASVPNTENLPPMNNQVFSFSFPEQSVAELQDPESDEYKSEEVLLKEIFDDDDNKDIDVDDLVQSFFGQPLANVLVKQTSLEDVIISNEDLSAEKQSHELSPSKAPAGAAKASTVPSLPFGKPLIPVPASGFAHTTFPSFSSSAPTIPSLSFGKPLIPIPPSGTSGSLGAPTVPSMLFGKPLIPSTLSTSALGSSQLPSVAKPTVQSGILSTRPEIALTNSSSFPVKQTSSLLSSQSSAPSLSPTSSNPLSLSSNHQRISLADLLASSSLSALQGSLSSPHTTHLTFSSRQSSVESSSESLSPAISES